MTRRPNIGDTVAARFPAEVGAVITSALLALLQPIEVDALVPVGRGRVAAVGQVVFVGWGACVECFEVEP